MSLTPEQAFKIGFLQACAEDGLTLEETKQRVKQAIAHKRAGGQLEKDAWAPAIAGLSYLGGKALGIIPPIASALGTAGLVAGVGLPIAAGGSLGYLAAKANSGDGKSLVEDAKNEEIIGEYERLAEEAKRRAELKKIQQTTGRRVVALSS